MFLLSRAQGICPELQDASVAEHWSGLRPGTADGLPILGKSPLDGLIYATGHYRNGILLAPITAKLIAELVTRREVSIDLAPFSSERFRALGG
jgi:glycine/D-amino acid oxidase-like deaminating enzyme